MKKMLSLLLALSMLICVVAVFPSSALDTPMFKEGDELYMKVISPAQWEDANPTMYVNFTEFSRADNGNKSVIIADADKSKYDPRTGVEYLASKGIYKYTVTSKDAGKTAMRFWRGNAEKLWNCSIVLSAQDYADGYNMVTIDGGSAWDDMGDKLTFYELDVAPTLEFSKTEGEIGDTIEISLKFEEATGVNYAYEMVVDGKVITDTKTYTYTATKNGAVSVTATVIATDNDGKKLGEGSVTGVIIIGTPDVTAATNGGLFAHAYSGSEKDSEAWVKWYDVNGTRHFLMPTCTNPESIEIYNAYSTKTTFNGVTIEPNSIAVVPYKEGQTYKVNANNKTYSVVIMRSSAEAAVFINNPESFNGKNLWDYLTDSKENYTSATAAALDDEGNLDLTPIKKIKGRGNTSWNADKKGFNITYDSAISLDGMQKCKKFSIISNFQDAALSRNRILYDLADEVGVPYASDSRFTEIYVNGDYIGNYMMCEKVDVGKNTLMPDIDDEDYLNFVNGTQADFEFVCELDNNPSADDFTITMGNRNNITMKAPELEKGAEGYNQVKNYIKSKYDTMWNKVISNASDVNDYIDIESYAQLYLINELGKNWDGGAGSFYFVYKPDENGHYKFYASPVWDYDNSLGNARGVSSELDSMGVRDYELPTGWFIKHKKNYAGPNVLSEAIAKCDALNDMIPTVWFEQFLPALQNKLNGKGLNNTELYSADVYLSYLTKSADMNYKRWEMVTDSSWISNHTSLKECFATYQYNEYGQVVGVSYKQNSNATTYTKYSFADEFKYMIDWTNSRTAWLSDQYFDSYTPSEITKPTEPTEPETKPTEPVLPDKESSLDLTNAIAAWQFDPDGKEAESKLTEYGTGDDGYKATYGNGTMSGTIDGTNMRALEWSAVEYGTNGLNMVPIMPAGKNNLWGTPYVQFEVSTKDYTDITFTAYMAGSKKCPASWKLSYSTDGKTFTDIENAVATITMANRKLMVPYLENFKLPSEVNNLDSVILRLSPVSDATVSGGTTADDPTGGELAINNILISGTKKPQGLLMGDVDLDGEITIMDATAVQLHLAQLQMLSEESLKLADVDGSSDITIMDTTTIQLFLAQIIDKF